MASTSKLPDPLLSTDEGYDSADDPDFTPASATAGRQRARSGSPSRSASSAGSLSDDDDEQDGRSSKRARTTVATRSGHVYGADSSAGSSSRATSSTAAAAEGDAPPRLTFVQLQALDRQRTERLLASGSGTGAGSGKGKEKARDGAGGEALVRVRVRRRFAGEDVWEEKLVPASSKEAQIWAVDSPGAAAAAAQDGQSDAVASSWPNVASSLHAPTDTSLAISPAASSSPTTVAGPSLSVSDSPVAPPPLPDRAPSELCTAASTSTTTADDGALPPPPPPPLPPPPAARPPPPKKRKSGGLAAATAALKPKGKKMTTLQKSAMDWREHRARELTEDERLALARNRQAGGGGFLDDQAFLGRVDEHRWGG